MKGLFELILAELIRRGDVVVEVHGLDMDQLQNEVHNYYRSVLQEAEGVLLCRDMTDGEKVEMLKEIVLDD